MEPIKIEVQIGLKEETISAVKQLLLASIASFMELAGAAQAEKPAEASEEAPKAEAEEVPTASVEAAPAPSVEPADDMPDFSSAQYTDDVLADATRKAVAGVKAQGKSPLFIKTTVFEKYGISESKACKPEQRAALYADLKALWKQED